MSCIDLLFCTNQNTISNYGVDVSIFDKYDQKIIFGKVNIRVPLPPTPSAKSGITVKQMWKKLCIQYLILIGVKLLKIFP